MPSFLENVNRSVGWQAVKATQGLKAFGGEEENKAKDEFTHIAIVYKADGHITTYRNGKPYGKSYKTGSIEFSLWKFSGSLWNATRNKSRE